MSLITAQGVNVRQEMQAYYQQNQETIIAMLAQMGNDPLILVGINYLRNAGHEKVVGFATGVVNYIDYLVHAKGTQVTLQQALTDYAEAYSAKVYANSPDMNSADANMRMIILEKAQYFDSIVAEISRVILPHVAKPQQSLSNNLSNLGNFGNNGRRQATGGLTGGFGNQAQTNQQSFGSGVFGASSPTQPPGAGGVNMLAGGNPVANNDLSNQPTTSNTILNPQPTQVAPTNNDIIERRTLKLMNYDEHKTYAFLKPYLVSAIGKVPMDTQALDNSLAALNQLTNYTKLKTSTGLVRDDIEPPTRNKGYQLAPIDVMYEEQCNLTRLIEEEPAEVFKVSSEDLANYSYGGTIHQYFPTASEPGTLTAIIDDYRTGIMTHSRFVQFLGRLEEVFGPRVCMIINEKISQVATSFWRFSLNQVNGEVSNYLTGHQAVSEYLKLHQSNPLLLDIWDGFPRFYMTAIFKLASIPSEEGSLPAETFFSDISYVRIPYASWHLSLGARDSSDADFAVVAKQSTPGLYHICKGIQEAGESALHRVLITTDGRIVEVIKPISVDVDYFYITELSNFL